MGYSVGLGLIVGYLSVILFQYMKDRGRTVIEDLSGLIDHELSSIIDVTQEIICNLA